MPSQRALSLLRSRVAGEIINFVDDEWRTADEIFHRYGLWSLHTAKRTLWALSDAGQIERQRVAMTGGLDVTKPLYRRRLADRAGFEPAEPCGAQRLSRAPVSTAHTPVLEDA